MSFKSIFFLEAQRLIQVGRDRIVQASDRLKAIPDVDPRTIPWKEDAVDWNQRSKFLWTFFKVSRRRWGLAVFYQVIASLFSFATPFLIHEFITKLQQSGGQGGEASSTEDLVVLALGFGLCGLFNGVAIQHYFMQTLTFNQIAINLVNKKIFQHSLRLSALAKSQYQVGDIVNYMSADSDAIGDASITCIDLLNAIFLLVGCSIALFYFLGWSALVAIVVMAILVPITHHLSRSFMHLEEKMFHYRDRRITLMSQVLNAIRVVKYFVWEKSVLSEVGDVRSKEMQARLELSQAEIFWGLVYTSISSVVLFFALLTHVLRGKEIDLALIFTCISIFAIMEDHFGGLSRFISRLINILVSSDRIVSFLKSETIGELRTATESGKAIPINKSENENSENKDFSDLAVKITDLLFRYETSGEHPPLISKLNFTLNKGQSLAVVGAVGSGKSTLLHLILSELIPTQGIIHMSEDIKSKIAYVSQEPYIINSTLRENIEFGNGSSEKRLDQAIKFSALEFDLLAWPAGLETEIGEKGVNLSGGQRQRVSLARAFYSEAELILLDDPLSAVDPNTESFLCDSLIFGAWKDKTRIIVTHRLGALSRFDKILFIESGECYLGNFTELSESLPEFQKFLKTHSENVLKEQIFLEKNDSILQNNFSIHLNAVNPEAKKSARITEDEDRAIGAVEKSVYFEYVKALGGNEASKLKLRVALLFSASLAVVVAPLIQKLWLSQAPPRINSEHWLAQLFQSRELAIVLVYGLLGLLTMLVTGLGDLYWANRGIAAGKSFHDQMLKAVLQTSIRFFDSTPIGRVLQRFSRDVESVDIHLQWSFNHTIHAFFHIIVSFLLIVFVLPVVAIFLIPIFWIYYRVQNDYRRVAREIKRLDSMARSPRYAHFKETLQGLFVIRAFDKTAWAMNQFYDKLKFSVEMSRTHFLINRWFSVRLPLIGAGISTVTGLGIIFSSQRGYVAAGTAGLVTVYAIDFWRRLNWGVRIFSDLESRLTSIERLQFYANLPPEQEVHAVSSDKHLDMHWPRSGSLQFKNVSLRYAPHLPLVLNNLSFEVKSGQRVGLIGRTGSGKSTIFQSVYRFVEIEVGEILLDGVSIHKLPLSRLRRNLAVIPQDPTLFMGTLRSNIDRYEQASDSEVWSVLRKVSLEGFVRKLPGQLKFAVAENGANISQGQRQLICLARALLMKVKIVFLDEATASVDVETDALVQKVVRESLTGITLITIAHRLSTLDGYDSIIELGKK